MNRIHIVVDDKIKDLLEYYKTNYRYSYSKTISEFIIKASEKDNLFNELNKAIKIINNRQFLTLELLKQLYSDLEIENITNPYDNKSLMQFLKDRSYKEK